jgi:hypothetical protein
MFVLLFIIISLVFIGLVFLFIVKSSGGSIIKVIFWLTFLNIFFTHVFFSDFIIDTVGLGISTVVNWFSELILFVLIIRMFLAPKYKNKFLGFNLFTFSVILLILSTLFNFQSIPLSILSIRVMYIPLLFIYVVYIYQMDMKSYEWFFKMFLILAVVNSTLSIIQFVYREQLGWSTQFTGGIFGYHGTGTGAMFSVVQSSLCLQMFFNKKKKIYLLLAFFISIPIMTGYAYGGFAFLFIALVIISFQSFKKMKATQLSLVIIYCTLIIYGLVSATQYFQSTNNTAQSYLNIYANSELYYSILTNTDIIQTHESLGRITKIYFALNEITKDLIHLFMGHGPGSISYNAATLGYTNSFAKAYQGSSHPLMTYIYELGIWGPFLLFISFYFLYKKWKVTQRPQVGISQYYYDNFIVLIIVFLLGTFYTAVLNNLILVMFFAVQASYLNKLYMLQKMMKSNYHFHQAIN